jgi:hypothetical protein
MRNIRNLRNVRLQGLQSLLRVPLWKDVVRRLVRMQASAHIPTKVNPGKMVVGIRLHLFFKHRTWNVRDFDWLG